MGGYWSGGSGSEVLGIQWILLLPPSSTLPWICSTPIPLLLEVLVNNNSRLSVTFSTKLQPGSESTYCSSAPTSGPSSEEMAEVHKSSNIASKKHLCAAVCVSVLPDGLRGSWTPAQTPCSHSFLSWLCAASLTPLYRQHFPNKSFEPESAFREPDLE